MWGNQSSGVDERIRLRIQGVIGWTSFPHKPSEVPVVDSFPWMKKAGMEEASAPRAPTEPLPRLHFKENG